MLNRDDQKTRISATRDTFESLVVFVIFALFATTFVLQPSKVPTGSMEDTILPGDKLVVNRFIFGPEDAPFLKSLLPMRTIKRGDIIVFKSPITPETDFVKRVIATGGDTIELKNRSVYINGRRIIESYTKYDKHFGGVNDSFSFSIPARDDMEKTVVPEGNFFVMGDNRDNSNDSRFWGFVPRENIKGKAFLIMWSVEGNYGIARSTADSLYRWYKYLRTFFTATRWHRLFTPLF